jgi:hypothetical protein
MAGRLDIQDIVNQRRKDCLTYREMSFEEIMNEFIFLSRPYPFVQSRKAGLNSRLAGMLNTPTDIDY